MIDLKEYIRLKKKGPNPNSKSIYHKPYRGEQEDYDKIVEYNKNLLEKYSWLTPFNEFTGVKITTKKPGYYGGNSDVPDYNYEFTILDDMPYGWRLAFGEQMCEEIHQELVRHNFVDEYRIVEIKEKFGGLRWYDNGTPIGRLEKYGDYYVTNPEEARKLNLPDQNRVDYYEFQRTLENGNDYYIHYIIKDKCRVNDIIDKYEQLSYKTCILCGRPAKWISTGWISPFCGWCKRKFEDKKFIDIDKFYKRKGN